MGEVLLFAYSFVLSIAVPAGIVRGDLAHLSGDELARAWPDASLWLAVVVFGPLSVPIHFIRTRRSWWGALLALLWLGLTFVLILLPVEALGRLFGVGD